MKKDFYTAVADRRSFYGISKEGVTSDERIKEVIELCLEEQEPAPMKFIALQQLEVAV